MADYTPEQKKAFITKYEARCRELGRVPGFFVDTDSTEDLLEAAKPESINALDKACEECLRNNYDTKANASGVLCDKCAEHLNGETKSEQDSPAVDPTTGEIDNHPKTTRTAGDDYNEIEAAGVREESKRQNREAARQAAQEQAATNPPPERSKPASRKPAAKTQPPRQTGGQSSAYYSEIEEQLGKRFATVKERPGALSKDKSRQLMFNYIDARQVMDRLDSVFGALGWSSEYQLIEPDKQIVQCTITVGEVSKTDVGYPNSDDGDTEPWKSAYSDALKRAAVQWGIGRFLYNTKPKWVAAPDQPQRGGQRSSNESKAPPARSNRNSGGNRNAPF